MAVMIPRASVIGVVLISGLAACASKPVATGATGGPAASVPVPVSSERLTGRWVLSPGDCRMPPSEAAEDGAAIVSPAGNVLTLAASGAMTSRQGDFVRRGTWKFDGSTLKIAVEPPPRRLDMGFIPTLEQGRLLLVGAEEMLLVYHRDPFVGVDHTP